MNFFGIGIALWAGENTQIGIGDDLGGGVYTELPHPAHLSPVLARKNYSEALSL